MTVGQRFERFLSNIAITKDQEEDGITKHTGVRSCLNRHYHSVTSGYANSMLIGSWGKTTRLRPVRDIDVLFVLPYSVYQRFQQVTGNKQSELLQEVKSVLSQTYSTTKASGRRVQKPAG